VSLHSADRMVNIVLG